MQGVQGQKRSGRLSSQQQSSEFRTAKNAALAQSRLPLFQRRLHVKRRRELAVTITVVNALCACAYLLAFLSGGQKEDLTDLGQIRLTSEVETKQTDVSKVPDGTRFVSLEIPMSGFTETELSSHPFDLLFIHADEQGVPRARVLYQNIKLVAADQRSSTARISVTDGDAPTLVALTQMGSFRLILSGGDEHTDDGLQRGAEQDSVGFMGNGFDLPLTDRPWVAEAFKTDRIEILE